MPEYCFYVFGPEDDYLRAVVLVCRDDDTAVLEAQRLLGGNEVEIWKEAVMIARVHTLNPSEHRGGLTGQAPDILGLRDEPDDDFM